MEEEVIEEINDRLENFDKNIGILSERMDKASKMLSTMCVPRFESDDLNELFEALAKAQSEMKIAKQDSTNPFFKSTYADLASVVKASRESLSKNGLSVIQRIVPNGGSTSYLHTRLCHSSGQWMESRMLISPPRQDIQTVGSYITYLRRYTYAAIVGVVASEEDDDAEEVMKKPRESGETEQKKEKSISKAQLEVLAGELEGYEDVLESLLKGFKINKLSDLPCKKYTLCIDRIREIKRAKE